MSNALVLFSRYLDDCNLLGRQVVEFINQTVDLAVERGAFAFIEVPGRPPSARRRVASWLRAFDRRVELVDMPERVIIPRKISGYALVDC
jgi:hypothetical protein